MKKNVLMYLLIGCALWLSIVITDFIFLPYLEKNGAWPPSLATSEIIFFLSAVLIFFLLRKISKQGDRPTNSNIFLFVYIVIIYPWALRTLDVLLRTMGR